MGHWEKSGLQWYETSVTNCQLCGKMIPADIWVAHVGAERKIFCDPGCEELYKEYWLKKYADGGTKKPVETGQGQTVSS